MAFWGAIGGALISGLFGKSAADSQAAAARKAGKYAEPGLLANKAVLNYLLNRLGKESPLLAAQYEKGVTGVGRAMQTAKAQARTFWGDTSRSRGEAWRINLAGQEALSKAALAYASEQEQYKTAPVATLQAMGAGAPQLAAQAALSVGQAQVDLYTSFASILGDLIGQWNARQLSRNLPQGKK